MTQSLWDILRFTTIRRVESYDAPTLTDKGQPAYRRVWLVTRESQAIAYRPEELHRFLKGQAREPN